MIFSVRIWLHDFFFLIFFFFAACKYAQRTSAYGFIRSRTFIVESAQTWTPADKISGREKSLARNSHPSIWSPCTLDTHPFGDHAHSIPIHLVTMHSRYPSIWWPCTLDTHPFGDHALSILIHLMTKHARYWSVLVTMHTRYSSIWSPCTLDTHPFGDHALSILIHMVTMDARYSSICHHARSVLIHLVTMHARYSSIWSPCTLDTHPFGDHARSILIHLVTMHARYSSIRSPCTLNTHPFGHHAHSILIHLSPCTLTRSFESEYSQFALRYRLTLPLMGGRALWNWTAGRPQLKPHVQVLSMQSVCLFAWPCTLDTHPFGDHALSIPIHLVTMHARYSSIWWPCTLDTHPFDDQARSILISFGDHAHSILIHLVTMHARYSSIWWPCTLDTHPYGHHRRSILIHLSPCTLGTHPFGHHARSILIHLVTMHSRYSSIWSPCTLDTHPFGDHARSILIHLVTMHARYSSIRSPCTLNTHPFSHHAHSILIHLSPCTLTRSFESEYSQFALRYRLTLPLMGGRALWNWTAGRPQLKPHVQVLSMQSVCLFAWLQLTDGVGWFAASCVHPHPSTWRSPECTVQWRWFN